MTKKTRNALGGITTYTNVFDGSGQTITTNTAPDGGTTIETYAQDGSLLTISGTAAHPMQYLYGVESDGGVQRAYTVAIALDAAGGTNEWTKIYTDLLGRQYKTVYAGASSNPFSISYYNTRGQLINQLDPDGVSTLYAYNARGEPAYTILDLNQNGMIDFAGTDRITFTGSDVLSDNGTTVHRTRTWVWNTLNSNSSNLVSTTETSLDGLSSWSTTWNNGVGITTTNTTVYGGGGYRFVTNAAPDGTYSLATYLNGNLISSTALNPAIGTLRSTAVAYDPHGRQNTMTDARNGGSTNFFNVADEISGTASPKPDATQAAQVTTNFFDTTMRVWKTTLADGTSVTNEFQLAGDVNRSYGSRTYPVGNGYDSQGRATKMTNWSTFAIAGTGTGARVTTWNFDSYRGWLTNKVYDGNTAGPAYTHTDAGRLKGRLWARGTNTAYAFGGGGDLASLTYNDGTTANLTNGFDRLGRKTAITNGSVSSHYCPGIE